MSDPSLASPSLTASVTFLFGPDEILHLQIRK